mmetsp:Transcript_6239/g.10043  ORF Transcript_6239/g.10043 Transcript_6239/m.10043 type:complete len:200 (-) Transcript_6239:264-863(-)
MVVCAWLTSSSSLAPSENVSSSLLSSPSQSQVRPQTHVILRHPSLRTVGTPHPGQLCACLALSLCKRSLQVTPRCQEETLHLKQKRSPQHGVRCLGNRCSQASCTTSRRSRSTIHGAFPLGPKTLLNLVGGEPPHRCPHEYSSSTACRKSSAGISAKKNRRHASARRSRASGSNAAKGSLLTPLAITKYEFVSSQATHL